MPTYDVTDPSTGQTISLTGDSPPTSGELEQIFSRLSPGGSKPKPTSASTFAGKFVQDLLKAPMAYKAPGGDILSGVERGIKSTIGGLVQLPEILLNTPGQVKLDIQSLFSSPSTALPAFARRAGSFAFGMVPGAEVMKKAAGGQPISIADVSQSATEYGLSIGMAKGIGATKKLVRSGVREIPGAGVELHAEAIPKAEALAASLSPTEEAVKAAYQKVANLGQGVKLSVAPLEQTVQDILNHELQATKPNADLIAQAKRILDTAPQGWDWEFAQSEARRMGKQVEAEMAKGGEKTTEIRRMYASLRDSIDQATPIVSKLDRSTVYPGEVIGPTGQPVTMAGETTSKITSGPGGLPQTMLADAFQNAQKMARRSFAVDDLTEVVNKSIGVSGTQGFNTISTNRIVKWIEQQERSAANKNKQAIRFVNSFELGELAAIKAGFRDIGKNLAQIPQLRGTAVGSSERLLHGAVGEVVGGGTTGFARGIIASRMISEAMMTPRGRTVVRWAVKMDPTVGPQFTQTMAAFLRSTMQQSSTEVP